jgi:gentisate 1,2-dioxygenase
MSILASLENGSASMDAFREDIARISLAPLWDMMRKLAPHGPQGGGAPIHWDWNLLRATVLRAGELISAEQAERRVLVLENPAFVGQGKATSSLYAGIQLLLPGEIAPSHRHTASALRLIIEGRGAYTAVDGERVLMSPGDFIVTPTGTFHDHGNDGAEPVLWLDGLDVFIVNLLNAAFGDNHPQTQQPVERETGTSAARYASGISPTDISPDDTRSSLFAWPYERSREALVASMKMGRVDRALGAGLRFTDPLTGRSPVRTMRAGMRMFPAGFAGESIRSISGSVVSVVEGSGSIRIGAQRFPLRPHDVFVIPSWHWHSFSATEDLVIFAFSDEELQRHLGFWREERATSLEQIP